MERTQSKRGRDTLAANFALPPAMVRMLRLPEPQEADFTPTRFQPASSKVWFTRHYLRFVSSGFPRHGFTQRFYGQLMHTFGMVARYDQAGFWAEYFTSTCNTVEFLAETVSHPCCGQPGHTWCDVERFIIRRLRDADLLGIYRARLRGEDETRDRAELARLLAMYPTSAAVAVAPIACGSAVPARAAPAQLTLGLG
jgi:hypothetical protein